LAAGLLVLAAITSRSYLQFERARASLVEIVRDSGLAGPQTNLERLVSQDHDLARARLRVAQGLLDSVTSPGWLTEIPKDERPEALARADLRLSQAREMAASVLQQQPASWRAAVILGGCEVLSRAPGSLLLNRDSWEKPLRAAQSIAPGEPAPSRYLAFAHFGLWSYLDSMQREQALDDLRLAFADQKTFDLMIDPWLGLLDRERLLEIVPDEIHVWKRLEELWTAEGDWHAVALAHRRWREARTVATRERLEDAMARIDGGDLRGARDSFRALAAGLMVGGENLDLLVEVLTLAPPGSLTPATQPALRQWLDLLLDLCYLGHCHAPPRVLERLLQNAGEIEPPVAALARILAGDLPAAETIEHRFIGAWSEPWGRYQVLSAEALLDRGEPEEARQALLRVAPIWQDSPRYWQAKLRLAEVALDAAAGERALEVLSGMTRTRWQAEDWRQVRSSWELDLYAGGPSSQAVIAWSVEAGGVVETSWDGHLVETLAIDASRAETVLAIPGHAAAKRAPAAHRVRIDLIAGKVAPRSLRLLGPSLVS